MQLLRIANQSTLKIEGVLDPKRLQQFVVAGGTGKEKHLEDLILEHPSLLNYTGFVSQSISTQSNELLIISRQLTTTRGKRADLLAIHWDGSLVIIEVKRDAEDEAGRSEGMEFQAIRYAAASRKMSVSGVVDTFAAHLRAAAAVSATGTQGIVIEEGDHWRKKAVAMLCKHLEDAEEQLTESDLEKRINPATKQRIYLVAASFSAEAISACAWLREHKIDISCFSLSPYEIAGQLVLGLERIIPPPALDDLMTDSIATPADKAQKAEAASGLTCRSAGVKPTLLVWSDDESNPIPIASWKALAEQSVRKAILSDLPHGELPMPTAKTADGMHNAVFFDSHDFYADLLGSSTLVQKWVCKILDALKTRGKELSARIEIKDGSPIEIRASSQSNP